MKNKNQVIEDLLLQVPEFKVRYDSILKENDGKILTHVIFGELTRFFISEFKKGSGNVNRIQQYLAAILESKDKKNKDLVICGFLENLYQAGDDYERIKAILLPVLANELENIDLLSR